MKNLVEYRSGNTRQGGDTEAQRFGEVYLAVHCPRGDVSNLPARPSEMRQLFDDFLGDQSRINISDDQARRG